MCDWWNPIPGTEPYPCTLEDLRGIIADMNSAEPFEVQMTRALVDEHLGTGGDAVALPPDGATDAESDRGAV